MKILVAIDFSDASKRAYNLAVSMAQHFPDSSIVLVAALDLARKGSEKPAHSSATSQMWEESDAKAVEIFNQQRTEKVKELIRTEFKDCIDHKVPCVSHIEVGDPREVILRYALLEKVDHIVMGSRGLNPLVGIQVGSVSDYCVRNSLVPVTVVK